MVTAAQLAEALPTIRTSLSKFAKDKDALDELVQNAALKIWAARAKCCYQQSSLILKWMLLVAKRTALRVYRDATSKARFCADAPIQYKNAAAPSGSRRPHSGHARPQSRPRHERRLLAWCHIWQNLLGHKRRVRCAGRHGARRHLASTRELTREVRAASVRLSRHPRSSSCGGFGAETSTQRQSRRQRHHRGRHRRSG